MNEYLITNEYDHEVSQGRTFLADEAVGRLAASQIELRFNRYLLICIQIRK